MIIRKQERFIVLSIIMLFIMLMLSGCKQNYYAQPKDFAEYTSIDDWSQYTAYANATANTSSTSDSSENNADDLDEQNIEQLQGSNKIPYIFGDSSMLDDDTEDGLRRINAELYYQATKHESRYIPQIFVAINTQETYGTDKNHIEYYSDKVMAQLNKDLQNNDYGNIIPILVEIFPDMPEEYVWEEDEYTYSDSLGAYLPDGTRKEARKNTRYIVCGTKLDNDYSTQMFSEIEDTQAEKYFNADDWSNGTKKLILDIYKDFSWQ